MDEVFARVDDELSARKAKHQSPGDWYALGRLLGASRQRMYNWQERRAIPSASHKEVADALGWSLDRLVGGEDRGSGGEPDTKQGTGNHLTANVTAHVTLSHAERAVIERLLEAAELLGVNVEAMQWTSEEPRATVQGRRRRDAPAPLPDEPAALTLVPSKGKGKKGRDK